jgi:hypothetical protein
MPPRFSPVAPTGMSRPSAKLCRGHWVNCRRNSARWFI